MNREQITPESMKLNEVEPDGFTSEPRILSKEIARVREQVQLLYEAVGRLVDLQSEANQKLDTALASSPTALLPKTEGDNQPSW